MDRTDFWKEVVALQGSATPLIRTRVLVFVAFSSFVWLGAQLGTKHYALETGMGVAPYEIVGAILALLLVMRTNSGYDRWYEGRKLWGGIVNQSRNLALIGLTEGPRDRRWRDDFARWVAAFSHSCKYSLRGDRTLETMRNLLDKDGLARLAQAEHMPLYVTGRIANLLREAVDSGKMDRFAYLQALKERSHLIDHIGACERIQKTPLARAVSIKIRRFLFLYLLALPFGIVDKAGMLTPLIVLLVAYPLLSLDQIGIELQSPFMTKNLNHLPLDDIASGIEKNVMGFLEETDREQEAENESNGRLRPRIDRGLIESGDLARSGT